MVIELLCTFTFVLSNSGSAMVPARVGSAVSIWPTVMPPVSVPPLEWTRSLETSVLWFQPWRKIPPPPCELLMKLMPSMRDGLHLKLLGHALQSAVLSVSGTQTPFAVQLAARDRTPFARTVIPAPSYAPMSVGSCKSSAILPLRLASQPTAGSSGIAST